MQPFIANWLPSAINELAMIWITAADRGAVNRAANEIDRLLRIQWQTIGAPAGANFVFIVPPLKVTYRVSPDDYTVWVLAIAREP